MERLRDENMRGPAHVRWRQLVHCGWNLSPLSSGTRLGPLRIRHRLITGPAEGATGSLRCQLIGGGRCLVS